MLPDILPARSLLPIDSMLVDGLVYFVAMTAVNALNMIIFIKTTQAIVQSS